MLPQCQIEVMSCLRLSVSKGWRRKNSRRLYFIHSLEHPEEFKASQEWRDSAITDEVPFSIGFKDAHPFLAEYHRSIAFKSGKRLDIDMDTGGGRDFAVYEIGDGRYCIVDCFDYADLRGTYIINPESETVESKHRDEMPQQKSF